MVMISHRIRIVTSIILGCGILGGLILMGVFCNNKKTLYDGNIEHDSQPENDEHDDSLSENDENYSQPENVEQYLLSEIDEIDEIDSQPGNDEHENVEHNLLSENDKRGDSPHENDKRMKHDVSLHDNTQKAVDGTTPNPPPSHLPPLTFSDMLIDGTLGSTCASFTKIPQEHDKAMFVLEMMQTEDANDQELNPNDIPFTNIHRTELYELCQVLLTADKMQRTWHYAFSSIWREMTLIDASLFLSTLKELTPPEMDVLEILEKEGLFPETMHPINRVTIAKQTTTFNTWGVRPLREEIFNRFRKVKALNNFELDKEAKMWQRAKLGISPFAGTNVHFQKLSVGLDLSEHHKLVKMLNDAKQINIYAPLYASILITSSMLLEERLYIIQYVAAFRSEQVRVLFSSKFQNVRNQSNAFSRLILLNAFASSNRNEESVHAALSLSDDLCHQLIRKEILTLHRIYGFIDGSNKYSCNAYLAVCHEDYIVGYLLGQDFSIEEVDIEYERICRNRLELERFTARKVDLLIKTKDLLDRKPPWYPSLDYCSAVKSAADRSLAVENSQYSYLGTAFAGLAVVASTTVDVVTFGVEILKEAKETFHNLDPGTKKIISAAAQSASTSSYSKSIERNVTNVVGKNNAAVAKKCVKEAVSPRPRK